jgi:hypothetical protein
MADMLQVHPSCLELVQRTFKRNSHMTQQDFASAVGEDGTDPKTLRKFLDGELVSRRKFQELCEALELNSKELVVGNCIEGPGDSQATIGTGPKVGSNVSVNVSIGQNSGAVIPHINGNVTINNSNRPEASTDYIKG